MQRAVANYRLEKAWMISSVAAELNVVKHQSECLIPFER
jgi:hypothetical protein